jgi:hypothetical protein
MNRTEVIVLLIGLAAMVAAVAAVDWRLGLFVLGATLVAAAVDVRLRR